VMLSVQSLVNFAGSFVGSIVLGPLAQATSISVAWFVCAGLLGLTLFLYLAVDRRRAARGQSRAAPEAAAV